MAPTQEQLILIAKARRRRAAAEQAPVTPKSSYDEMAAVPQRSTVGTAPQWDRQATADDRMLARGQDPINEANNNLRRGWESGNVGEMVSGAQTYARNLVRKPPTPKQAAEAAGTLIVEASGAGQIGRVADYVGQRTGNEFLQTDAFKTGPDYDPTADMAALPLNALSWSTRAAGGGLINPRSATAAVKNAAKDVATNFTMGGSDLATAAYKGGRNALSSGPPAPQGPSPAPVAQPSVAQAPPRPAQAAAPGAGQGAAQPVLNAVPTAPVVPKGQIRVAKDTAKILTRIMRSSRIKDADVRGYLPGAVQRYKALNDERVPFAFFLESDLPNHFPQPIADEVTTKLRTWGRERNSATGPQDTSRRTIQETTQTLRSGQQDYLSGVMDNNLYKGKLIGKEDQFKGELEANGRVAYNTAIKNANDSLISGRATVEQRDAVGRIQELLHNPAFLKNVPEHLRVKALRDKIDIEDYVQKDPIAAAHWLQSELRQAVSAAEGVGGVATSESRLYGEMRDGLLKELEKFNGYKGARKAHGDIYGAVEAINFGDSFFKAARSEVETARLAREFKALSKRQKTAATMSIRDALKNEFRNKAEDTAAKVTRLQQAGVLDALETVLGADGKRVSDAIRNVVKQNDQLKAIDQGSGSPTFNNMRGADAARDMVQSPVNKAIGAFGDKTSWPMTVAGDVVLASSGLPPVLTAGKAATALVDRFGNPSAKTMSRATEGLYGLPKAPQNALAPPPRTPRVGGPKAPKAPPTQQTLDDLLAQYDAIDHRAEPGKAASVLKKIETLKKQLESGTSGPALLGSSKKPPQKMGFGGGGKADSVSQKLAGVFDQDGVFDDALDALSKDNSIGKSDWLDVYKRMFGSAAGVVGSKNDIIDALRRERMINVRMRKHRATLGNSNFEPYSLPKQSGFTGAPEALGAGAGAVLAPDANGDGTVDGAERFGGMVTGLGIVGAARYGRGKFARKGPPASAPVRSGSASRVTTPAEDLARAKAFNADSLTPEAAHDWSVMLRGETDLRKVMDLLGIDLNPTILKLPRGKAMVERTRDAVLARISEKMPPSSKSIKVREMNDRGGYTDEEIARAIGVDPSQMENVGRYLDVLDGRTEVTSQRKLLRGARSSPLVDSAGKGPPAPKGSYGSRPSAMGDLAGHQAAQRQLRELEDYRKTAPPSEHAAVDQEIADLRGFLQGETPPAQNGFGQFGRQIGPPRPPGMKAPQTAPTKVKKGPRNITVSPEIAEQMKVVRKANADERKAMKKNVMRPDRDELNAPWTEARIAEEDKLAQMQAKERSRRVGRVARRQTFQRIAKHPTTSILAGGAALGAGYAGLKTAFPDKQDEPEDTSRPGYWFDRVATQDKETASKMQLALHQWGVWPTEMRTLRNGFKQKEPVEMTGRWGRASKDAFKRWLYEIDPTRDPEDPITPEDVERLLAGPKGYQDDDGHWQNPRDRKPIAAR